MFQLLVHNVQLTTQHIIHDGGHAAVCEMLADEALGDVPLGAVVALADPRQVDRGAEEACGAREGHECERERAGFSTRECSRCATSRERYSLLDADAAASCLQPGSRVSVFARSHLEENSEFEAIHGSRGIKCASPSAKLSVQHLELQFLQYTCS